MSLCRSKDGSTDSGDASERGEAIDKCMLCSGFVTPDLLNGQHYCQVLAHFQCLHEECFLPREWDITRAKRAPKLGMVLSQKCSNCEKDTASIQFKPIHHQGGHHVFNHKDASSNR